MGPEFMFPSLFIILAISFVALIAIGVGAMHDARQLTAGRTSIVRRGYIYLVSFVTLLFVGAALINLIDIGARAWVFPSADPYMGYYESPPPALYLSVKDAAAAPTSGPVVLECANGCALTDQQKNDIANWEQSYRQWRETGASSNRTQALITPLSFFLVALLVFAIHWRLVRRDQTTIEEGNNLTRSTYFTAMGFVWLVACVITAGFLVNTLLRMAIPGAERDTKNISYPVEVAQQEQGGVESILTCGPSCGVSDATVALARDWQDDYAVWQKRSQAQTTQRSRQNALSLELSLLIIGIPLMWYHLRTSWRKKKQPSVTV
jgi:hypothetical protein